MMKTYADPQHLFIALDQAQRFRERPEHSRTLPHLTAECVAFLETHGRVRSGPYLYELVDGEVVASHVPDVALMPEFAEPIAIDDAALAEAVG